MNFHDLVVLAAITRLGVSSEVQPESFRRPPRPRSPDDDSDLNDIAAKYRQERTERKRANFAKRNKP